MSRERESKNVICWMMYELNIMNDMETKKDGGFLKFEI